MIDSRSAQRIHVPAVDPISGYQLYGATTSSDTVKLIFARFIPADHASELAVHGSSVITEAVTLPLSTALVGQLAIVARQGRIEVFDNQGRSRRLFVARQGKAALELVVADHVNRVNAEGAAKASEQHPSDIRIWGAGSSVLPNRRRVVALSAGVVGVALRYETTIKLISTEVGKQRLEFIVEVEGTQLLATWDSPAPEQVLLIAEAASMGTLFWSGVVGDDRAKPQLVKIDIVDPEQFHSALRVARGGLERQERRGMLV